MAEKTWYMACLDLEGADCLVVGGGSVGFEKAQGLLTAGAAVTVVAPQINVAFDCLPARLVRREFEEADLDGRRLAIAATSVPEVNEAVFAAAEARNLFCHVADLPCLCSVVLPAV